jgi:septum site-determining protein MinC
MRLQAVNSRPRDIQLRGRSLLALVLTPEPPLAAWLAQLDAHLASAASGLMEQRPVIVDLACAAPEGREMIAILLEGLEARGLRIVGVERAGATLLAGTAWARLAAGLPGRDLAAPAPPATQPSQLVEGPVRSGQTLVFESGDVTIVGAVASGAEVVAGGSIHVYGALRGRAIAGLRPGAEARIFCSRLEAEMVGVGRLYRTADHWGAGLHGRPAQVWSDRGALRLARLDLR